MNGAQKTIKAIAIALAIMIIVSVVSAFVGVGMMLDRVFWSRDRAAEDWQETVISDEVNEVSELYIDLKATSLKVERGAEFQVVADGEKVDFWQNGKVVYVKEKEEGFFADWLGEQGEVKVFLPEDMLLTKVSVNMGAGAIEARDLKAEELELSLGAGRTELVGLEALSRAKIDGGAGLLIVREAKLHGLTLDMGVGKVEIAARLEGTNKVNAGVGKLELTLIGEEDDYQVSFDQGIGAMTQQGISLNNPNGKNRVEIDGGVGAIDLRLQD